MFEHADDESENCTIGTSPCLRTDMPETPIPVDFNSADKDEAVRLGTIGTLDFLKANAIELFEGMSIKITDGEILADAVVTMRHGTWVAVVGRWDYV